VAAGTVLSFDFGTRRIGVAVGQNVTRTARALDTVKVRNGRPDWDALAAIIERWAPDRLILGKPATDDGSEHPLAPPIDRFARRLEGRFGIPVSFVDETLSSYVAERDAESLASGVDAVAARVILESWFSEN
jgi:putative holliday junction resolvase